MTHPIYVLHTFHEKIIFTFGLMFFFVSVCVRMLKKLHSMHTYNYAVNGVCMYGFIDITPLGPLG